jgi:chlorite dismutase
METITGPPVERVDRLAVLEGDRHGQPDGSTWLLRGITSNERYAVREEKKILTARQPPLGRPQATCAALIPIRKSAAWWNLMQDERREILETHSHHVEIGMEFLPAVARKLHHCRDLSDGEPFDFLTWFEYAPEHAEAIDRLVAKLRSTKEWTYVDREVDFRLVRADSS